jgi:hypothetical protein
MLNIADLKQLQSARFFANWDSFVDEERIAGSEQAMQSLVKSLVDLGPDAPEESIKHLVGECVERFNELDEDLWITTIERDDIMDQLAKIVNLCGMDGNAEWIESNRDW